MLLRFFATTAKPLHTLRQAAFHDISQNMYMTPDEAKRVQHLETEGARYASLAAEAKKERRAILARARMRTRQPG